MGEPHPKKRKNSECDRPWETKFRLPRSANPDHYDLYLNPDLKEKTFSGHVTIHISSSESRNHFLVHTKWLTISKTELLRVENQNQCQPVKVIESFEYEPNEYWVVRTEAVEAGQFRLKIEFSGSLTKGILGYYYSDYTDDNGKKKGLATTKFEPTYARRAFPCFDEPTFKSTYSVTLVRPSEDYIALGNMPIEKETVDSPTQGLTEVSFTKSVPMVTYLVCFIVCDFTFKEKMMASGMPFRVYGPESRIKNMQYALDIGSMILEFYEVMFDLPFPLPKSDMAAIPDYSSGATEHWGLITYRDTCIFYNEKQSSAANQQRVASVVAHELAHQWFGNLVTLEWWNDLWLNEGFASYVQYKGVDHIHPDWDMDCQFVVESLHSAFDIDARTSSHPIVQNVASPDQINAMFDAISYRKGSSIIRMLENFMGEEAFLKGINSFLKKFSYKNAVTQNLWDELTISWAGTKSSESANNKNIGSIMDTWTRQMGYPVLIVARKTPDTFHITQKRFLQDPLAWSDDSESPYEYRWDIPVTFITSINPTGIKQIWFYKDMEYLEITVDPIVTWIKLNVNVKGYYRVNYEPSIWADLKDMCKEQVLSPGDRASIYSDAFAMADALLMDYDHTLDLTEGLAIEGHFVPWTAACSCLLQLDNLMLMTNSSRPLKNYINKLTRDMYTSLGWLDTGDHLERLLRNSIISLSCKSDNKICLDKAAHLFSSWIKDKDCALPIGTRRQVFRWGIVSNSMLQESWDCMWERYLAEQNATEKDNLMSGLSNVQDVKLLLRLITLAQDMNNVRQQDFLHVLQYISSNESGRAIVWNWVKENWEWLVERYTLNDRYLGQLIPNITKYFASSDKLEEMQEFFAKYPESGSGELNRQQALETVTSNIRWDETHGETIFNWL